MGDIAIMAGAVALALVAAVIPGLAAYRTRRRASGRLMRLAGQVVLENMTDKGLSFQPRRRSPTTPVRDLRT